MHKQKIHEEIRMDGETLQWYKMLIEKPAR